MFSKLVDKLWPSFLTFVWVIVCSISVMIGYMQGMSKPLLKCSAYDDGRLISYQYEIDGSLTCNYAYIPASSKFHIHKKPSIK